MTLSALPDLLNILVLEPDDAERDAIVSVLSEQGYDVIGCKDEQQATNILKDDGISVVLYDSEVREHAAEQFLAKTKQLDPDIQVLLISKTPALDLAVSAVRHGAFDFLAKPVDRDQLIVSMARIEEHFRLLRENRELKQEVDRNFSFAGLVSHNHVMKQIFETVRRLSTFTSTVMITGESGTGKELLARAIHNHSPRKGRAFVAINCGAIPETLIESELFGHKKGAFTDAVRDKRGLLEEASGGTLFLDEIGEMPTLLQVKLLRALQDKSIRPVGDERSIEIDTRIIAATNRNLEEDIRSGEFREDLFYRLNVVSINLPPLRERSEDIPILVDHFINKLALRLSLPKKKLTASALAKLNSYQWPGNVRELENYLERALVFSQSEAIELQDLPVQIQNFSPKIASSALLTSHSLSIKEHSERLEIQLIKEALIRTNGNRTHAAKLLEISHRALLYKLKDYSLSDFMKEGAVSGEG